MNLLLTFPLLAALFAENNLPQEFQWPALPPKISEKGNNNTSKKIATLTTPLEDWLTPKFLVEVEELPNQDQDKFPGYLNFQLQKFPRFDRLKEDLNNKLIINLAGVHPEAIILSTILIVDPSYTVEHEVLIILPLKASNDNLGREFGIWDGSPFYPQFEVVRQLYRPGHVNCTTRIDSPLKPSAPGSSMFKKVNLDYDFNMIFAPSFRTITFPQKQKLTPLP
jgi:hypothetical protein